MEEQEAERAIDPLEEIAREADRLDRETSGMSKEEKARYFTEYLDDPMNPFHRRISEAHRVKDEELENSVVEAARALKKGDEVELTDGLGNTLGKLTLDDACRRDDTGFVPPEETCSIGRTIPPEDDPMKKLFVCKSFPIGTPVEEILAQTECVPEETRALWDRLNRYIEDKSGASERSSSSSSRQEKRTNRRREKKAALRSSSGSANIFSSPIRPDDQDAGEEETEDGGALRQTVGIPVDHFERAGRRSSGRTVE